MDAGVAMNKLLEMVPHICMCGVHPSHDCDVALAEDGWVASTSCSDEWDMRPVTLRYRERKGGSITVKLYEGPSYSCSLAAEENAWCQVILDQLLED